MISFASPCNLRHAPCHPEALSPAVSDGVLHHFVVVRSDLPRGLQAAHIVHAAGETSPGELPTDTHAVVLTVPSQDALRAVFARLGAAGVPCRLIVESGGVYDGQATAIGVVPGAKKEVGRYLSSLPMLR